MAKKVIIDIEVNGKMQKATLSAKKLKQALDETNVSQKNLDASTRKGYRAMQGSAQATSNSTKAFSKQAGVVGGLVPVYATFAANVFAVTAAFGVLKRAAALEKLETSLERLGALSGRNLGALAKDLRAVADEAISAEQSLRAVSVGTSAGFSSSQILQLTEVAKGASLALGRDMGDAIDRLIRGTAKLEPEILDELGIIVRLDQAASDYAVSLNKTANELSQFEKVQAFVNATITQGLNKYQKIADAVDPSPYDKLAASFADLTKEVVNFANAFLGPIVDFFATNKFALAGALTAFAGTLVKQVVPAIDEVVAKNRAIAATAQRAAKKSRQVIEGEYEKTAKRLRVLDVTPPIAKQIIPKVKAGEASIKDLKKAILSLQRSEKARDSQPANIRTEKYKQETAALRAQRLELEKLIAQEKGRLQYTSTGLNERTTSRIGRRTAAYGEAIDNAGFVKSLGIATEGVKRNAAEVAKAGTSYGKFGAAVRVAGSAVTLFGRAFLNLIPIIGQVLFIFSLVGPAIMKAFEKSAIQESIEESSERFEIFTKTIMLVREEIKEADSAFSAFAAQARASSGVFDEVGQSFIRLGKTIDDEYIQKLREAQEAEIRAQNLRGQASRNRKRDTARAQGQQKEAIEGLGTVDGDTAIQLLNEAELRLRGMGKVLPGVEEGFSNVTATITEMAASGTLTIEAILKALQEAAAPMDAFTGNIKAATQQFADFRTEVTKLENLQTTPFTAAIEQSKEFQKSANAALEIFFKQSPGKSSFDTPLKDLNEEFPQAVEFANRLVEELGYGNESVEALKIAMQDYNTRLKEANDILLQKEGILKKEQAILKEITRTEKISAAFTSLKLEQEDKVIDAQVNALKAQKTNVELLLEGTAETERLSKINADINALTESKKEKEEKTLEVIKAEFAEKQRLAQVEQKLADLAAKRAQQEFNRQANADKRTLRSERETNAFAFLTEDTRSLDLEIARTAKLLQAKEKAKDDDMARAKEMAELEYKVLAARLAAEASIARTRAVAALNENPNNPQVQAAAANLTALAGQLDTLSAKVGTQAVQAGQAAAEEVAQNVDSLRLKLEDLQEARGNLEGINILIDGAARSLESNMTGAFTALISGTKSAKQAFADMAKAILADIAAMIAKQLVLNMLIAATGGSTGFFGNLFGRQGGIFENAPTNRYGGITEKVQGYAGGGIAKGRQAGYPAILHGTEAVVPLPNGKEIPVDMRNGSGQTNNVTVNVSVDSNGNANQSMSTNQQQGAGLGKAIAMAVQKELQNQKRSGGILNPYGAA